MKTILIFCMFLAFPFLVFAQKLDYRKVDSLYIFFETKSFHILNNNSNFNTLEAMRVFLEENPLYKLALTGNCDDDEKQKLKDESLALSVARAVAVKNWLISKGVKSCRLVMDAIENERPIMPNELKNRRFNRRVDCFFFLEEHHNVTLRHIPDSISALDTLEKRLFYYPQDITPENARIIGDILENLLSKNPNLGAMMCRFDAQKSTYQERAAFLFEYLDERLRGKAFYFSREICPKELVSIKIYENICNDAAN